MKQLKVSLLRLTPDSILRAEINPPNFWILKFSATPRVESAPPAAADVKDSSAASKGPPRAELKFSAIKAHSSRGVSDRTGCSHMTHEGDGQRPSISSRRISSSACCVVYAALKSSAYSFAVSRDNSSARFIVRASSMRPWPTLILMIPLRVRQVLGQ